MGMNMLNYKSDETDPEHSNYLVLQRGGNGDYYIGVKRVGGGVVLGIDSVRFRTANGGASDHPRLLSAIRNLFAALGDDIDPHPPTRHCGCADCLPSFTD